MYQTQRLVQVRPSILLSTAYEWLIVVTCTGVARAHLLPPPPLPPVHEYAFALGLLHMNSASYCVSPGSYHALFAVGMASVGYTAYHLIKVCTTCIWLMLVMSHRPLCRARTRVLCLEEAAQ